MIVFDPLHDNFPNVAIIRQLRNACVTLKLRSKFKLYELILKTTDTQKWNFCGDRQFTKFIGGRCKLKGKYLTTIKHFLAMINTFASTASLPPTLANQPYHTAVPAPLGSPTVTVHHAKEYPDPFIIPTDFSNAFPDDLPNILDRTRAHTSEDAYKRYMSIEKGSKYKASHRKHARGALYKFPLFQTNYKIIDCSQGGAHVIRTTIEKGKHKGETTTIQIGSATHRTDLLESIVSLGQYLPRGNCRTDSGDEGDMIAAGIRTLNPVLLYDCTRGTPDQKLTRGTIIDAATARVSVLFAPYVQEAFPDSYWSIIKADKLKTNHIPDFLRPESMGGKKGLGLSMMVSTNYINSSHFDYKDDSLSISVWAEKYPGQAKNWYFLLPNLSILADDGTPPSAGVLIKLFHGATIQWDGNFLKHCSTVSELGPEDNQVYGCFMGSCR